MTNKIGSIPEFTQEESSDTENQEIKEVKTEEKGTPSESSTEEKPVEEESSTEETTDETIEETEEEKETAEDTTEELPDEDNRSKELTSQIQGLENERTKLLDDIKGLRGDRRDLREEKLEKVEEKIEEKMDDLSDIDPEGVALVERVLQAKGYVKKDEMTKTVYNQTKQQHLDSFLEEYPEFKPENDPDDKNWIALQEELKFYRMPKDPNQISKILQKARKVLNIPSIDRDDLKTKERTMDLAGQGAKKGPSTRSPSSQSFNEDQIDSLRRGGWTDEEINELEKSQ